MCLERQGFIVMRKEKEKDRKEKNGGVWSLRFEKKVEGRRNSESKVALPGINRQSR